MLSEENSVYRRLVKKWLPPAEIIRGLLSLITFSLVGYKVWSAEKIDTINVDKSVLTRLFINIVFITFSPRAVNNVKCPWSIFLFTTL